MDCTNSAQLAATCWAGRFEVFLRSLPCIGPHHLTFARSARVMPGDDGVFLVVLRCARAPFLYRLMRIEKVLGMGSAGGRWQSGLRRYESMHANAVLGGLGEEVRRFHVIGHRIEVFREVRIRFGSLERAERSVLV